MDGGASPPYTLHNQVRTSVAADRHGTKARRTADSIERACRAKGLRITGPRRVIARVIGEAEDHPDVVELHRRAVALDRGISLSTPYSP